MHQFRVFIDVADNLDVLWLNAPITSIEEIDTHIFYHSILLFSALAPIVFLIEPAQRSSYDVTLIYLFALAICQSYELPSRLRSCN